ncbi:MAG: FAD-binding oxidoreductase, partial [Vicinamibacteria bacterium]
MSRTPPPETVELVSFDGGIVERCHRKRPDRYWMVEAENGSNPLIARGGGYSYAAASFGARSLVLDMTRFDRLLGFDEETRVIAVEGGITLGDLLSITGPRNLILRVQPGYPGITVGGCIAAHVHGKNPFLEGTFTHLVESLTLFHPKYGSIEVERSAAPEPFELTCGGLGLTGVILSARLRLEPLAGFMVSIERSEIGNLSEALAAVRSMTEGSAFAYTWHDGVPRLGAFGRGFVYRGSIQAGTPFPTKGFSYRRHDAETRRKIPVSLLGGARARLLTSGFWIAERLKPRTIEIPLYEAMFPFARRFEYFLLYGRRGLAEYQAIVPHASIEAFLGELERRILRARPDGVMVSMKLFRGEPRLLRFEKDGVCLTLDFARSSATTKFFETLDEMCIEAGAIPNVIKDSRLPAAIVRKCYP